MSRPARTALLNLVRLEDRAVPATITVTSIGTEVAADGQVTFIEALRSVNTGAAVNADGPRRGLSLPFPSTQRVRP